MSGFAVVMGRPIADRAGSRGRRLVGGLLAGLAALAGGGPAAAAAGAAGQPPLLVPFAVDAVRQPGPTAAALLVYNRGAEGERLGLLAVRVRDERGRLLLDRPLDVTLPADRRFGEVSALVERLPREISEIDRRAFAAPGDREFTAAELPEVAAEIRRRLAALRGDLAEPARAPYREIPLLLPLERVLPESAPPGEVAGLAFEVDYVLAGRAGTARVSHRIERLAPWGEPPAGLAADLGAAAVSRHGGDLHVHSCHGEALGACAPSADCAAESLQLSGSFTYAQLKSQYQALGLDWFTATDHSYCVNSPAEYGAIRDETAAITDAAFIAYPDTEVSSDEAGPQVGFDAADLLCLGLTPANHVGAHGITSRKPGGSDDLLGFCDGLFSDALRSFEANIEAIRAEGGYPVANHPLGDAYAWNSYAATRGIEANALHGVEIWNGSTASGQDGHVGRWVDWLLDGRILYAYSGSDTHDAAFAFGATHAVLTGPFTPDAVQQALMAGRAYVSNAHFLALTARLAGRTLAMGDRVPLPGVVPPGTAVQIRAHHDFGNDTAAVTIYRGRVGEGGEVAVCESAPLTGAGTFACEDLLAGDVTSYYRAYSEDGPAARVAYTNPVFFLRQP